MFKRIFLSQPPVFRLPSQIQPTLFGYVDYAPYLNTPPRLYGEEIWWIAGMWITDRQTVNGNLVIQMMCTMNQVYWPGWNILVYNFDATTGEFLGIDPTFNFPLFEWAYLAQFYQARDGSLWAVVGGFWSGGVYAVDPGTLQTTTESYLPSRYGLVEFGPVLVEKPQNLLLAGGNSAGPNLAVYNLTSGALIQSVPCSGWPQQIIPEDARRCFVLCQNGLFNIVDYIAGVVLATFRAPLQQLSGGTTAIGTGATTRPLFTYDRFYRRLLAVGIPTIDSTGQSTTTISGWYPVPLTTGIGAPIPLKPIRNGRTVPVLVQTFGDAGEAVAGQILSPAVSGDLALAPGLAVTDNVSEARFAVTGTGVGTGVISATAQLPVTQ